MEHKSSKGDRVTVTNPRNQSLMGKTGTATPSPRSISGSPEYFVRLEDVDEVWVLREEDLEAEDAS